MAIGRKHNKTIFSGEIEFAFRLIPGLLYIILSYLAKKRTVI